MGNSDDMKWRVGVVILVLLNIQIALFIPSATAQQILPGIELECSTSSIVIHFDEVDSSNQIELHKGLDTEKDNRMYTY